MPRHNCSDLQRFAKNLDRSPVKDDTAPPELGPYLWTPTTRGGFERKKEPLRKYGEDPTPRMARIQGVFPVFKTNGLTYAAHRWLYFQLYDDRHLFDLDERDTWLCSAQSRMGVFMFTHDPRIIKTGRFLPLPSKQLRPWNMLFWYDPNNTPGTEQQQAKRGYPHIEWISAPIEAIPLTLVPRQGDLPKAIPGMPPPRIAYHRRQNYKLTQNMEHKRVELVWPEYVGPDRIKLVQHYLRGGDDSKRPEPSGNYTVTTAWKRYAKKQGLTI